jgi:polyisoprenyl-phosphate glycosyltransferase
MNNVTKKKPQQRKLISLVIPVLDEEQNVERCYQEVLQALLRHADRYDHEIIFTDNHSSDRTFEILQTIAQSDPRVRVLRFSRNFGYQGSILTGFLYSQGDAAIQIDCDLQDPIDLISDFLDYWERGYKVVYGVRSSRQENCLISFLRRTFYRLSDLISEDTLPHDAGDFRLIDRVIIKSFRFGHDNRPYLRGAISSMGFNQIGIPYDRKQRDYGASKFGLFALGRFATNGIVSHSIVPLRLAIYVGLFLALTGILLAVAYFVSKVWFTPEWTDGFATTTILILLGFSFLTFFIGIIGLYIGRILSEVRRTPLTIIEDAINIDAETPLSILDARMNNVD